MKSSLRGGIVAACAAALLVAGTSSASAKPGVPYIQYGDSGPAVKCVQLLYNNWKVRIDGPTINILNPDGVFGNDTLSKIKDYQSRIGSTPDGIVGPDTGSSLQQWQDGNTAYCWNYVPTYV
ncbi:peptidoglycan hydrolase-like protein with peptidoglycan-binding domain [Kitasatospora sp. MAA19]|uniref:peptidoglycan-binding domain-containing protein n=1 Tax=unclassified Kitasatospora TaxID=2633591 RepID=UPI00247428A2|nr:peptidoglycan-binding domain-containing protein [Kitasatospora sp. MAA19]MDH6705568.1 peptidoglycan hydrolase-like protein with peptidoglycan-binding domain [Kitasatospora sp. MAA19]